jgi:peptidoglycan/LPS O-acetylase OafA/YrhL
LRSNAQTLPDSSTPPLGRIYLPTLYGWRAVMIVLVLLCHDSTHHFWKFSTLGINLRGIQGVDMFFALSGLLICTRLLEQERLHGAINIKLFYLGRLLRIQPAALFYLLVVTLLMAFGKLDHAYRGVLSAALMVRNYLPWYKAPTDWYTGHFWSLAIEEHFYLFLPGFLLLVRRNRVRWLFGIALAFIVLSHFATRYGIDLSGTFPELRTEHRISVFFFSTAIAVLLTRRDFYKLCEKWLNPYAVLFVAIALVSINSARYQWRVDAAYALCVPLLMVSTALHPATLMGRILEHPVLRYVGHVTYSLYLWQMLFFTGFFRGFFHIPMPQSHVLQYLQTTWFKYPAAFAVALLSYYLVEKPCIEWGRRLMKSGGMSRREPAGRSSTPSEVPSASGTQILVS